MKKKLILLAALALGSITSPASAQDGNATLTGTGNWTDAARWSSSPGGFAPVNGNNGQNWNATVNANTVTVNTAIGIQNLAFGGGTITGSQTLTINGSGSSWTGGVMNGAGIIEVASGALMSITGTNHKYMESGRTLSISGIAAWTGAGGNMVLRESSISIEDQGLLDIQNDRAFGDDNGNGQMGAVLVNAGGTLRKSAGTGVTLIGTNFGTGADTVRLNVNAQSGATPAGRVEVQTGTLSVAGGGTVAGVLDVASGALLELNSAMTFNAGATISGTGTVRNNSTITLGAATNVTGVLEMGGNNSYTIGGSGSLTIASGGVLNWNGGMLTGSGSTVVASGGSLNFGGSVLNVHNYINNRTVDIYGTATWAGTQGNIALRDSALTVQSGGVFDLQVDRAIGDDNGNGTSGSLVIASGGVLRKSAGTGSSVIGTNFGSGADTVRLNVQAGGSVEVQSGTLFLGASTLSQSGSTLVSGNWSVSNGGTLTFNVGSNITTIDTNASVSLDGATSTFNRIPTTASTLTTNQGSFTLKNDRDITTASAFSNSGTVSVQDSATTFKIGATGNLAYTQTGTTSVTILAGGAMIDTSAFNLNGGALRGEGTIDGPLTTSGTTTIAPGAAPGIITINGSTTLGSGNTLAMEVGGLATGQYDQLIVNGVLTLGGLLDVDFINGFENSVVPSNIFTIATATSPILGAFSNVASGSRLVTNFPTQFEVWYGVGSPYGANNLVLTQTPEPSRVLFLLAGLSGIVMRRRRSWRGRAASKDARQAEVEKIATSAQKSRCRL